MTSGPSRRLSPGDAAPDFTLPADDGSTVSLADLRGSKVVLYVYPAAMTPGCTTQACDFRDDLRSFAAAGYRVLGLSPDGPEKLARFREKEGLTFPLLSDVDRSVMRAYGAYGEKSLYGRVVTGVIRSTFVIDEDGSVAAAQYAVRAKGHVARLRRDLGLG
jgi:peroxiredoxin Q/BCP